MNRLERALVVALCLAIGWFYVWTVRSSGDAWNFGLEQRDYYNLLIDGWLDGQLHMKVEVPDALLRLKDPYDPTLRPPGLGLHDATFYKGKYFIYFGVAPVVVLMLPFRILTGIDLPLAVATLVFVYGGFLASVGIWLAVRRRYFATAGTATALGGVWVLGLAALGPVLLRRPNMWELPIGAGYCFAMLVLLALWRSLEDGGRALATEVRKPGADQGRTIHLVAPATMRRRAWWYAGAGLALGLAIASRPTYLIAGPLLAVPLLMWWRSEGRVPWRPTLAALGPLAIIGLAMAGHNYARFDHPLQFGQAYQFSLDYESKMAHFRLTHAPFNVWRYYFSAAEWSRYFPFIQPAALPPKPPGFGGHDDVYGLLRNLPIAWLALLAPLALWRRERAERRALGAWLGAVAVLFAAMAGTFILFFGSLARYQSDFAPALMLLAAVGGLALERWLRLTRALAWRVAGGIALGGLAFFSAGFAVLFSLQLDGLLLERNPTYYRVVARQLNRGPAALERLAGVRHGPLELSWLATPAAAGTRELLFSAGTMPRADRVEWVQEAAGRARIAVESGHGVRHLTPAFDVPPGGECRIRVSMGSLLPPDEHPLLADKSAGVTAALTRRLKIEVNGATLTDQVPWYAAAPGRVVIGPAASGSVGAAGRGTAWRRDEAAIPTLLKDAEAHAKTATDRRTRKGELVLRLSLPTRRVGAKEPLVVAGRPGRGDFLAIEYSAENTIRFLLDHWGSTLRHSAPLEIDPAQIQEVRITLESLRQTLPHGSSGRVVTGVVAITLNGRSVWREEAEFFGVDPIEVAVGRNPVGGTTCGPEFTGVVHAIEVPGP